MKYQQARLNHPTVLESATEVHQINAQIVEVQKHGVKILKMLKYCVKLTKNSLFPYFAFACILFPLFLPITLFHADYRTDRFTQIRKLTLAESTTESLQAH